MPINKTPWDDDTVMPWGKHEGTVMGEVPPDYLQWLFRQKWISDWPGLHAYLRKNEDAISEQADELNQDRADEREGYESFEDYLNDQN